MSLVEKLEFKNKDGVVVTSENFWELDEMTPQLKRGIGEASIGGMTGIVREVENGKFMSNSLENDNGYQKKSFFPEFSPISYQQDRELGQYIIDKFKEVYQRFRKN